ncbi:MAG: V-type ATP synthase subunit A, partial [Candidatus Thiodiazotropha sp.]
MSEVIESPMTAHVIAVQDDIVTIESSAPLMKNEVVYVRPSRLGEYERQERLKSEVLRVRGNQADVQVFESTVGVGIGDAVEQSGQMLSVELGPGLLGQVYDGLQNPLEDIALTHGIFLPRGVELPALEPRRKWSFVPQVQTGARLCAGDVIGTVPEGAFSHKIMIPFDQVGEVEVVWIQEGNVTVDTQIATLLDSHGHERPVTLKQRWPVRRPIPQQMLEQGLFERHYPREPLVTTLRLLDTFFPIARG